MIRLKIKTREETLFWERLTGFQVVATLDHYRAGRANLWKSGKNRAVLVLVVLAAFVCGCGGNGSGVTTRSVTPPAARPVIKDANQEELLARYNEFVRNVDSVNATVELKTTTGSKYNGVINEYHEVKAFLLAARPSDIRMIGQVPVVGKTIFDMASDGENFELSIPSRSKFVEGPVALERASNKPIENLRPQHMFEALLWPEVRKEESVLFEEANDENARYYVLTVLRGGYKTEILRKIWFDRADLNVARFESYGPKGALLSDVRYGDWQPVTPDARGALSNSNSPATLEYPRKIQIERTRDEYRLDMNVSKITLNESVEAERFKLQAPAGAEVVHLSQDGETKKP
jgi:outer membrane lipoprotein-sorting protein